MDLLASSAGLKPMRRRCRDGYQQLDRRYLAVAADGSSGAQRWRCFFHVTSVTRTAVSWRVPLGISHDVIANIGVSSC